MTANLENRPPQTRRRSLSCLFVCLGSFWPPNRRETSLVFGHLPSCCVSPDFLSERWHVRPIGQPPTKICVRKLKEVAPCSALHGQLARGEVPCVSERIKSC